MLFAFFRFTKHEPVCVLPPAVMGYLPFRIDNRTLADFDDAITSTKAHHPRGLNEIDVRPLILVVVDVVGDLAKQNAFSLQNPICFLDERRECVAEAVPLLFRRSNHKPKPGVEILEIVFALVRNMGRVINNHVDAASPERHRRIVSDDAGFVLTGNVHADDAALAATPESTTIHGRVQDTPRGCARVERKKPFQKFRIIACPYRRERAVFRLPKTNGFLRRHHYSAS